MLWKFNPNQERSAFFDAVWKKYAKFAADQGSIADTSQIHAFCTTLGEATLRLIFEAESAIDNKILSPQEIDSIFRTFNVMHKFHQDYGNIQEEKLVNPTTLQNLKHALSILGEQMAEGTTLGWEYKLSGKFPQAEPKAVPEKNHARNGSKRPSLN